MSEAWRDLGGLHPGQASPSPGPTKESRKKPWPADKPFPMEWLPDGYAARKRAKLPRINLDSQPERFINHALKHGCKYVNWHRAWLSWVTSDYCKGEREPEPMQLNPKDELSIRRARAALQGKGRSAYFDIQDVRRALELGAITQEQAKRLGA